jgi:hypothetical protein
MPFAQAMSSNYRSPTGFGGFNLTLKPQGTLEVEIKVYWDFRPGQKIIKGGRPDGTDLVEEFPWDEASIAKFKADFKANIPNTWNKKWKFRCTNNAYAGVFEPVFTVTDANAESCHLPVEVYNSHSLSYLNAGTGTLNLHKYDNLMYDDIPGSSKQGSRLNVLRSMVNRLQELVQPLQRVVLKRNANDRWEVAEQSRGALQTLAQSLGGLQPYIQQLPITISASSGASDKAPLLICAILAFMAGNGVNPKLYTMNLNATKTWAKLTWPWTAHKETATASIAIDEGNWKFIYRVSDHEFGHCLGLPDEYTLYAPNSRIGGAHDQWRTLCQRANIEANRIPAQLGASLHNSSLMSYGWVTCACHYVTIWDALTKMTLANPYGIQANEWRIEPGTETQKVA